MTFRDVKIVAGDHSRALWPHSPHMKFFNCHIKGSIVNPHSSSTIEHATQFVNCTFDDSEDPIYGLPWVWQYIINADECNNVLFKDCIIRATRTRPMYLNGSATARGFIDNVSVQCSYGAPNGTSWQSSAVRSLKGYNSLIFTNQLHLQRTTS